MNWCKFAFLCCLCLITFETTKQETIDITNLEDVCAGADFVCGRCPQSVCPECYPGGQPIPQAQCCQQRSLIQALTAASIQASVNAVAAATAGVAAATKAVVGVAAVATSGAYVSVTESFSLNPDATNCQLSHEVVATANGYSAAAAIAAAEAEAVANATAFAYAAASASASAAAKLFATAESLINSTCCGFDLQTYQLAIIAGQYVTNASMAVEDSRSVTVSTYNCSSMLQTASASVNETATTFLNHTVDNCCNPAFIPRTANQTVSRLQNTLNAGYELNSIISYASDQLTAYGIDNNTLEMATASIASSRSGENECANYPAGCCLNSTCCRNTGTIEMATDAVVDILLHSSSVAQAYLDLAVETVAQSDVLTAALANATAAVVAATYAASTLSITKQSCYAISIAVDSNATAQAKVVATSFAAAAAAAVAVSNASSSAYSLAMASARGVALAQSAVLVYGSGCCQSSCCSSASYPTYTMSDSYDTSSCCDIVANYQLAQSEKAAQIAKDACSTAYKCVSSVSAIANSTGAADCTNMIRKINTSMKFILNVVCCTTSAATTVTATKIVSTTKTATTKVTQAANVGNLINKIAGKTVVG